jgi:hypothetical protein
MTDAADFRALAQFLGCYFHQDWNHEFQDAESAVHAFREREGQKSIQGVVHELEILLAESRVEADLRVLFLTGLGCYVEPSAFGLTFTEFAIWLRDVLKAGTAD